jgi:predicted  nucleic acid-binding Zn-ribbon protein
MREASAELRDTLNRVHNRQESVNAVETIKNNIEGFNQNAVNLQKSMERFDGTVDHTFTKIDSEMGQIVEKLSTFASLISEQNRMIIEKMDMFKEDENTPHV